jgi:hypothetical protein
MALAHRRPAYGRPARGLLKQGVGSTARRHLQGLRPDAETLDGRRIVRKTFDRWLAHRAARFHHPPRVVLLRKRYVELRFAGVTPAIRCSTSTEGMVGLYASYQGEWWDLLAECDVVARRTSTG